jgi:hypothetical protein
MGAKFVLAGILSTSKPIHVAKHKTGRYDDEKLFAFTDRSYP